MSCPATPIAHCSTCAPETTPLSIAASTSLPHTAQAGSRYHCGLARTRLRETRPAEHQIAISDQISYFSGRVQEEFVRKMACASHRRRVGGRDRLGVTQEEDPARLHTSCAHRGAGGTTSLRGVAAGLSRQPCSGTTCAFHPGRRRTHADRPRERRYGSSPPSEEPFRQPRAQRTTAVVRRCTVVPPAGLHGQGCRF